MSTLRLFYPGDDAALLAAVFHRGGVTIGSGIRDGTVKLWDMATQQEIATLAP